MLLGLLVIAVQSVEPANPCSATDAEIKSGSIYDAVFAVEDVTEYVAQDEVPNKLPLMPSVIVSGP
jgi:hypothetical protein